MQIISYIFAIEIKSISRARKKNKSKHRDARGCGSSSSALNL